MASHPVPDEYLSEALDHTDVSPDRLESLLEELQANLYASVEKLVNQAWFFGGVDNYLSTFNTYEGVWFGFTRDDLLHTHLDDRQVTPDELLAVYIAHESFARDRFNLIVDVPDDHGQNLRDRVYFPVYIELPEAWRRGYKFTAIELKRLCQRELRPAEVLDYWVCVKLEADKEQWIAARGVDREAINKNIRQAKAKLQDESTALNYDIDRIGVDQPSDGYEPPWWPEVDA